MGEVFPVFTAEHDYESVNTSLHFNSSTTDASITVQTVHDVQLESDLSLSITVSNLDEQTGVLFLPDTAQLFITDDDSKWIFRYIIYLHTDTVMALCYIIIIIIPSIWWLWLLQHYIHMVAVISIFNTALVIGVFVPNPMVMSDAGSVDVTVKVVTGEIGEAVMLVLSIVEQKAIGVNNALIFFLFSYNHVLYL